jgi:hypothetical protein
MRSIGPMTCVLILGASVVAAQSESQKQTIVKGAAGSSPWIMTAHATNPKQSADQSISHGDGNPRGSAKAQENTQLKSTVDLPDTPSAHVPLSGRQKFNLFLKSTYEPYTFFSAAFGATLAQAEGQWYGYGGGLPGWGKRFGASLADTESRRFIQGFVFSTALHQDPRYFRSSKKKTVPRAWYAITRVLVTRADDGHETFNSSEFLGTLFTSSLQNAYYPEGDRGFGNTMNRFLGALSSDASSNLLREFWPEIRRLFRKHAPEKIQDIERRIPKPDD